MRNMTLNTLNSYPLVKEINSKLTIQDQNPLKRDVEAV